MGSIGTTRVEDVMVTTLITVVETDKMEDVARVFKEQDIHAAPVIDKAGSCVGIITSHDLMEYEAVRKRIHNELTRGSTYNSAHYGSGGLFMLPGQCFDDVGFHMTKQLETAAIDDSLAQVAREMCKNHRHHVLVLNANHRPIGMLSSLDLLGFITGEPVCRSKNSV